jgi:hypothetical protein
MPFVLTTASTVTCTHNGKVNVEGAKKLKVGGNAVLLEAGIDAKSISGCVTQDLDVSGVPKTRQCQHVASISRAAPVPPPPPLPPAITAGKATKLKVNGMPVMLDTLKGLTDGLDAAPPTMLAKADAGHTKLSAK